MTTITISGVQDQRPYLDPRPTARQTSGKPSSAPSGRRFGKVAHSHRDSGISVGRTPATAHAVRTGS